MWKMDNGSIPKDLWYGELFTEGRAYEHPYLHLNNFHMKAMNIVQNKRRLLRIESLGNSLLNVDEGF